MIEIKGKEILIRGEKCVYVSDIELRDMERLPAKYTNIDGAIRKGSAGNIEILWHGVWKELMSYGQNYDETSFEQKIDKVKKAGRRLWEVKQQLARENENWGKELSIYV